MIKKNNGKRIVAAMLGATIVFSGATVALGIIRNQKVQENLSKDIMTINEVPYNIVEYKYFYLQAYNEFNINNADYLESFQIDPNIDYHNQQVFQNNQTWGDVVDEDAYNKMAKTNVLYSKAISENFNNNSIAEEKKELCDKFKNEAVHKNMTADQYAARVICSGCSFEDIEKVIDKVAVANAYADNISNNVIITDEDIEKYYNENSKNFDIATYRYFTFNAQEYFSSIAVDTESSESEVQEKALEKAKADAISFFDKVVDEESFKKIALEYVEEGKKENYKSKDQSLSTSAYVEGNIVGEWLFDDNREYKDTAVLFNEAAMEYYVVMYIGREKNTNSTANARMIYLPYEPADINHAITDEDIENTQNISENILSEIEKDKTEETFSHLAIQYSKDINTKSNGGLISNITNRSLVPTVSDWLLDERRITGDITSIDVETGIYILYFKGFNKDEIWYSDIKAHLQSEEVSKASGWGSNEKLEIKILN